MSATVKGTPNATTGTSVTIPTHAIGDLIIIWAYRDGSTTTPTKPAASGTVPAWVDIDNNTGANTNSARTAQFVATATNHTSGTWTNATGMAAVVVQGQKTSSFIGGHAESGSTAANSATAPSITQQQTTGKALILEFYGHRTVTAWSAAPTNYTRQASVATEVAVNTKDSSTTDGSIAQANTASSSGYRGATIEVLAPDTTPTVVLNTPADTATGALVNPDLNFTGTDAEGDTVEYEVEIHGDNTFGFTTVASDTFIRANGGLGANWTNYSGSGFATPTITSNTVGSNADDSDAPALWSGAGSFTNDQFSQATITFGTANGHGANRSFAGLIVRAQGATSFCQGQKNANDGTTQIYDVTSANLGPGGATYTLLATSKEEIASGSVVRMEVVGSTVYLYDDGVLILTTTTSLTTGTPGILPEDDTDQITAWSGGNITAPLIDKKSTTDAGFTAGHPFASGVAKDFVVQAGNTLTASTQYFWRVRANDPGGTNDWGVWSSTRSFTTASSGTSIKTINGLTKASIKTINGLAIASVKTWNGLA